MRGRTKDKDKCMKHLHRDKGHEDIDRYSWVLANSAGAGVMLMFVAQLGWIQLNLYRGKQASNRITKSVRQAIPRRDISWCLVLPITACVLYRR